jgi:hypothetical protein
MRVPPRDVCFLRARRGHRPSLRRGVGEVARLDRRGGEPVTARLSEAARTEARRILDGAARRLLAEGLDADAIVTAAGSDRRLGDNGANERAALVASKSVPVTRRNDHRGSDGAL